MLSWLGGQTFPGVRIFRGALRNLKNSQVWHSAIAARGLAVDRSLGGEKSCSVYSLFCIFTIIIVIIITIISNISISFVALLNRLYLNP